MKIDALILLKIEFNIFYQNIHLRQTELVLQFHTKFVPKFPGLAISEVITILIYFPITDKTFQAHRKIILTSCKLKKTSRKEETIDTDQQWMQRLGQCRESLVEKPEQE